MRGRWSSERPVRLRSSFGDAPLSRCLRHIDCCRRLSPVAGLRSAPPAGSMTPKQAALKGLTVTRNAREPRVDKLIVGLQGHRKSQARAETLSADRAQSLGRRPASRMKALRPLEGRAHLMQLDRSNDSLRSARRRRPSCAGPDCRIRRAQRPFPCARGAERSRATRNGNGTSSRRLRATPELPVQAASPQRPSAAAICRQHGTCRRGSSDVVVAVDRHRDRQPH